MYVCHCNAVTDRDVRAAIAAGARDVDAVATRTGAGTTCGGCTPTICALLCEDCPVPRLAGARGAA